MDASSINLLKKLEPSQIKTLGADIVLSQEFIDRVEQMASDDVYELEPDKAKQLYDALENSFLANENEIKQNSNFYKRFGTLLLGLLWKSLPRLQPQIRKTMLANNVIFCLKSAVAIKTYLKNYLDQYEKNFDVDESGRKDFITALESNQEKIGTQFLSFKTSGQVPPAISNWIKDYNTNFPLNPKKPEAKRGKLEQLNYLKSSPNVKTLIAEDKKMLEEILGIYDWLRFPVIEYRPRRETAQSRLAPPASTGKSNAGFELPTTKLNIPKSKSVVPPAPKVVLPPKPAPVKLTPPPAAKPEAPKPNLGLKDLGPYVLGGNPEQLAPPPPKKPIIPPPPKLQTPPEPPQDIKTSIPSNKYAGFSSDLIKDIEEFSDSAKTKYTAPPPTKPISIPKSEPISEPKPAPKPPEPVKQKLSPAGPHELEDLLERSRLKADANIPLSESDTKAIIDLIKRKKESQS